MTVINFTKKDARLFINLCEWASEEVEKANLYTESHWDYSKIKYIDGTYKYVHPDMTFDIEVRETKTYFDKETNKEEISVIKGWLIDTYAYVRGVRVESVDFLNMVADDIEDELGFVTSLDFSPVSTYVSKLLGIKVNMTFDVNADGRVFLYSSDIVKHAGVCQAMLKTLKVTTFGSIGLSIDNNTGEQYLYIPALYFDYEHTNGGHNGYEIGRVKYDIKTCVWTGLNPETKKYEVI